MRRALHLAASCGAALALAAACGGSSATGPHVAGAGGSAGPSASPPSPTDATHAYLSYASCLRAHGANEPDPSFGQDGSPTWAVNPKTLPPQATQACGSILQSAQLAGGRGPTAAQLAQLTRFSRCIRQHGVADFPDPSPDGNFQTTRDPVQEPGWNAALQACRNLMPSTKG
jgi:hypothetical protein